MRKLIVLGLFAAPVQALLFPSAVLAQAEPEPVAIPTDQAGRGGSDDDRNDAPVDVNEDGVGSTVITPDLDVQTIGGGPNPARPRPPRCTTRKAIELGTIETSITRVNPVTGRIEEAFLRRCEGQSGETWIWTDTSVNIEDVIDGATDQVREQLPSPSEEMSPSPEVGGVVNLGLWLAVADPGVTVARASVGAVWAEGRGELSGLSVDFGNGDSVDCVGVGVRIEDVFPDLETFEEGPCGYTYRESTPDGDPKTPFTITFTSTYSVTFTTSTGRTGTVGDVTRTVSFDYDVDEIQTVGRSN